MNGIQKLQEWKALGWRRAKNKTLANVDLWKALDDLLMACKNVRVVYVPAIMPLPGNQLEQRKSLRRMLRDATVGMLVGSPACWALTIAFCFVGLQQPTTVVPPAAAAAPATTSTIPDQATEPLSSMMGGLKLT